MLTFLLLYNLFLFRACTSSSGVSTASENLSDPLTIRNAPNETIPLGSLFDISRIDLLDPADFNSGHLFEEFVLKDGPKVVNDHIDEELTFLCRQANHLYL